MANRESERTWRTPKPDEAVNNGPLTMAMIKDVLLTIATAQGPWLRLECEDEARALGRGKTPDRRSAR